MDGAGDFVNVLAARALRPDRAGLDFGLVNKKRFA
jgi:hypothetical protein